MPWSYLFNAAWRWIADQGITLALLIVVACLVPRIGRFLISRINRYIEDTDTSQENKSRLAITSVGVYIAQLVAYFFLFVMALQTLGFSLTGAAIPATVASAALGLGAQSIIADFLAGFFILTEKQYGIGDWVRFEGNGIKVEGDVIQITMRATRIRTLSQETVTVPNSTAKICINSSNFWSRAVVVIPVPLLGSENVHDAIARTTAATERALAEPDIASEVLGTLDVQPAVSIKPPATVGMPWMIDMRLMVQVEAGSQWKVERAIRTSIVDEFWDEYGSAPTVDGSLQQELIDANGTPPHTTPRSKRQTPAQAISSDSATTEVLPEADPAADMAAEGSQLTDVEKPDTAEEADKSPEISRKRWILSLGGKIRPSTTLLLAALGFLLFLWVSTIQTSDEWEGGDGWLAPPQSSHTSYPQTPEPEYVPQPTFIPEPTTQTPTVETTEPTLSETPTETTTPPEPTPTEAEPTTTETVTGTPTQTNS